MWPESEAERAAFIDENSCNFSFLPWCAQGHHLCTEVWPMLSHCREGKQGLGRLDTCKPKPLHREVGLSLRHQVP